MSEMDNTNFDVQPLELDNLPADFLTGDYVFESWNVATPWHKESGWTTKSINLFDGQYKYRYCNRKIDVGNVFQRDLKKEMYNLGQGCAQFIKGYLDGLTEAPPCSD